MAEITVDDQVKTPGVITCDTPKKRLIYLHGTLGLSWRKIAQMDDFSGIKPGTLERYAHTDYEPKDKRIRGILGLPSECTVVVIGSGAIPPGAQVIYAEQCSCGQWYVSNHPRRKRCFICSPYKKGTERR